MGGIREPAVAGYFYPGEPRALAAELARLLEGANARNAPAPKALIVPHAGYAYSGAVAASGYKALAPWHARYRRVVLVGPCHRVLLRGLATSGRDAFRTPLGDVPLDTRTISELKLPVNELAHRDEHSLEVHLPFLQAVLGDFELVPVVVGDMPRTDVAATLASLWDGPETLIVISSDLSHYLDYASAIARDRGTSAAIEAFADTRIGHAEACGATPLGGLLIEARRRKLGVSRLDLRNSGDTSGLMEQVVGYGSWSLDAGTAIPA